MPPNPLTCGPHDGPEIQLPIGTLAEGHKDQGLLGVRIRVTKISPKALFFRLAQIEDAIMTTMASTLHHASRDLRHIRPLQMGLLLSLFLLWLSLVSCQDLRSSYYLRRHLSQADVNPSLRDAYIALQAWKAAITRDPTNVTGTWVGPEVCNYKGVFCSPSPDGAFPQVVSGIDLNHALLTGRLVPELDLLKYLALFHINTNDFRGSIPSSFRNLTLLFELDVSNNRLSGKFLLVVLGLSSLAYLDIRYNLFQGSLPAALFDKELDAIFVNKNDFQCSDRLGVRRC